MHTKKWSGTPPLGTIARRRSPAPIIANVWGFGTLHVIHKTITTTTTTTTNNNNGHVLKIPSRELTYPPKMAFWRWFSFPKVGYVNSLEDNAKEQVQKLLQGMPSWSKYLWTNIWTHLHTVGSNVISNKTIMYCTYEQENAHYNFLKWCKNILNMCRMFYNDTAALVMRNTKGFPNLVTGDTLKLHDSRSVETLVMNKPTDTIASK